MKNLIPHIQKGHYANKRFRFSVSMMALTFLSVLSISALQAQGITFGFDDTIPLLQQNDTLPNAWAGGVNAGQYNTMHLNADTMPDLVVFDRSTNKLTTFLASWKAGKYYYQHTRVYAHQFPDDLQEWVLLLDYNRDGKKDIFTHSKLGVKVYQNSSTENRLAWTSVADPLETQGASGPINLQVYISDIPAITDLDNDGDLDILTFDAAGYLLEHHQNLSMETYYHTDSLIFRRASACWGKFNQGDYCGEYDFDIECENTNGRIKSPLRVKHGGSFTLLAIDLDGDGDKDLLNGHIGCEAVVKLTNQGSFHQAQITEADVAFPASKPIHFPEFPAVFYEDLDFDGIKDLVAAPNVAVNQFDLINFSASTWLYKNTGSNELPVFDFLQNDFLQSTMLDVGDNAFPALADYDGDGDLDLFIGNRGNFESRTGEFYATIYLYDNIGTPEKAVYQFNTADYLNLSALRLNTIKPYFTDINGDNITDLAFTSTLKNQTKIRYILNTASAGQLFQFSADAVALLPLILSTDDTPLLYDLDGDNDLDVLVGKSLGNLEYYLNTGTSAAPVYTLQSDAIRTLPDEPFERNITLSMADWDGNGKADLLTGDQTGNLKLYPDLMDQLQTSPIQLTSVAISLLTPGEENSAVSIKGLVFPTAADLDRDNLPELLIGTQTGGVVILKNKAMPPPNGIEDMPEADLIYPNPTNGELHIHSPQNGEVSIFSLIGQQVIATQPIQANQETTIHLRHLPAGVYLLRITSGKLVVVKKIVRQP